MARAYPGYVYHPFPKMVHDNSPLGYKIVNSQEELDQLNKELEVPEEKVQVPVATRKKPGPKPKNITEE